MRLALAISVAYASFIFCRSFFPVTQAAMMSGKDQIIESHMQANIIINTFGVAFGLSKFPTGVLVNYVSPRAAVLMFMAMTAAAVALASFAQSYEQIWWIALLNAIPQAGAYPAVTKLVCASFEPSQHESVFAMISIGSRAGQVAVSLVLGEVLRWYSDWRVAISVAPFAVLISMLLLIVLTRKGKEASPGKASRASPRGFSSPGFDSGSKEDGEGPVCANRSASSAPEDSGDPSSDLGLSARLARLVSNPRFWLVNTSASMLLISKGFDTFAVRYLTDLCEHAHLACASGMSCNCKAYAPQVTAGVSLGIVISLVFGSFVYERLKSTGPRAMFIVFLCTLNLVVAVTLWRYTVLVFSHEPGSFEHELVTLGVVALLLFLLGFAAGYPFYIPQSLFAVEFGAGDAATVVGCGECIQGIFGAVFTDRAQRFATKEDGSMNWVVIWLAIVIAAGGGLVLMAAYMNERVKTRQQKKEKEKER